MGNWSTERLRPRFSNVFRFLTPTDLSGSGPKRLAQDHTGWLWLNWFLNPGHRLAPQPLDYPSSHNASARLQQYVNVTNLSLNSIGVLHDGPHNQASYAWCWDWLYVFHSFNCLGRMGRGDMRCQGHHHSFQSGSFKTIFTLQSHWIWWHFTRDHPWVMNSSQNVFFIISLSPDYI